MTKICTIIGSRVTPKDILMDMEIVSKYLCRLGVVVRSGKAGGADAAAIYGCMEANEEGTLKATPEMYVPWKGFGDRSMTNLWDIELGSDPQAESIAKSIHPAWDKCSQGVKKLHTRNVGQILGKDLNTPSDLVLYWCKESNGKPTGGTATAVNLATSHQIRTCNMLNQDWRSVCREIFK